MWSRSIYMKIRLIRFNLSSSPTKLAVLIAVAGHGRISIQASTDSYMSDKNKDVETPGAGSGRDAAAGNAAAGEAVAGDGAVAGHRHGQDGGADRILFRFSLVVLIIAFCYLVLILYMVTALDTRKDKLGQRKCTQHKSQHSEI